ncbi:hypothetical protein V8E36_002912 [Tilletia maclaganii]
MERNTGTRASAATALTHESTTVTSSSHGSAASVHTTSQPAAASKSVQHPEKQQQQQQQHDVQDPDSFTLRRFPWRRHVEPFDRILAHKYDGSGTTQDPYIVSWLPNDAEDPMNKSDLFKWYITLMVSLVTLAVGLGSSAYSGAIESLHAHFGGSQIELALGVSLWVLGFLVGPLIAAPCSETFGRRSTLLVSYAFLTLWNGMCICAPNLPALLIFRFLAGAFGASPLTNSGGTIADIFPAGPRSSPTSPHAAPPAPCGPPDPLGIQTCLRGPLCPPGAQCYL